MLHPSRHIAPNMQISGGFSSLCCTHSIGDGSPRGPRGGPLVGPWVGGMCWLGTAATPSGGTPVGGVAKPGQACTVGPVGAVVSSTAGSAVVPSGGGRVGATLGGCMGKGTPAGKGDGASATAGLASGAGPRPIVASPLVESASAAPWVSGAPASDFLTTKVRLPAPVAPPGWPSMSGAVWGLVGVGQVSSARSAWRLT